jgi:hypothetical protein
MLNRRLFLTVTVSLSIIVMAVQANMNLSQQAEIKITYPKENQVVPSPVAIKGTISGQMPDNQYMWILANPQLCPGQFWPQGDSHITPINGQWSWLAYLGGKNDGGNLFNIIVVLVDNATDKNFTEWANLGKAKNEYPSIRLPENAKIKDNVTLIRGYDN